MPKQHTVKQGEHLMRIAEMYGFDDYRTIWEHPENADLRNERRDPNILYPGDLLYIPDRETREEPCETGRRHVFRVHTLPCTLRLRLRDLSDEPVADSPCKLRIEGDSYELATDAEGQIEQGIPCTAERGLIEAKVVAAPLKIGHLDPVAEVSGQHARLCNLGYYRGAEDKIDEELFRLAIEEFQCDENLTVTGQGDEQTQAKLVARHGC